ncbi:uncharacterized protein LOC127240378 [Andrographis paniculata]|uniref:uncharacterized protein LOC127240378 n=1 Tax=Andrographis paniculata TaxID=175694 RepID=UPI0021E8CDC9|nr:uncharacterized protein LOC127240378 [Andrographis paniculata]
MSESFTIQISSNLVSHLLDDGKKVKKKTRKPKPRIPREPPQTAHTKQLANDSNAKGPSSAGWPLDTPLYLPVPSQQTPKYPELDSIKSVLHESEKVVERLQKQEESLVQEVTQRAKELHEKEFKLPHRKPMPCSDQKDACLTCYKEHVKDPLKCAQVVKDFADCARRARQQLGINNN